MADKNEIDKMLDPLLSKLNKAFASVEKLGAFGITEHEKIQTKLGRLKVSASRMNSNIVTLVFESESAQKEYFDSLKKKK